jgi:transcriptional regulator with XRE-family HTH domain
MTDLNIDHHAGRTDFGNRVRARRHQLQLSQEVLAERAGIHRTYVSNLEGGKRNVSLDNILRLAEALEVPPGQLFVDG